jgi:excisionase family DNA binding protein
LGVSYTGAMPVIVEGVEYLTAGEAAEALGVKRETLYAYASRGRLRSYRRGTGRARLYRADEIRALTQIRADRPPDYLVDASTWMDGHS